MPVRIIDAAEAPGQVTRGHSIYHAMPEWPEALALLGRLTSGKTVEIMLSAESRKSVRCPHVEQQFAAQLRKHFRRNQLRLEAYARGKGIYIRHARQAAESGLILHKRRGRKPKAGMPLSTGTPVDAGQRACPYCGAAIQHSKAKTCPKRECQARWRREYAKKYYQGKLSKTAREKKTAGRRGRSKAADPETLSVSPDSFSHGELPADSEHSQPFDAVELKGMEPLTAMIHWARRHHDRLDPERATPFFALAGTFGISDWKLVEQKLVQMIEIGAAQRYFNSEHSGGVFSLRKRERAA